MLKNDRKQYEIEKVSDKIEFCKTRNKIVNTDFLDMAAKGEVLKFLKSEGLKNYFFEGGKENADRSVLVIYPEKITKEMARNNIDKILEEGDYTRSKKARCNT